VKRLEAGLPPCEFPDRRRRCPRSVRGDQGLGIRAARARRAALEFYTEVVTVYQDA